MQAGGEERRGECVFEQRDDKHTLGEQRRREQQKQQVEGAGEVIGKQRNEVCTDAGLEGVQHIPAVLQHFPQLGQHRAILMVQIDDHDRLLAERPHAEPDIGKRHAQKSQKARYERIERSAVLRSPKPLARQEHKQDIAKQPRQQRGEPDGIAPFLQRKIKVAAPQDAKGVRGGQQQKRDKQRNFR